MIQDHTQRPPRPIVHDLPIARRNSAARFLEKRKQRLASRNPLALRSGSENLGHIASSSSEFATANNGAHPGGQDQCGSGASRPEKERVRETNNREGTASQIISREVLEQNFGKKRADVAKIFGISVSTFKRVCRDHGITRWPYRRSNSAAPSQAASRVLRTIPTTTHMKPQAGGFIETFQLEPQAGGSTSHPNPNALVVPQPQRASTQTLDENMLSFLEDLEKNLLLDEETFPEGPQQPRANQYWGGYGGTDGSFNSQQNYNPNLYSQHGGGYGSLPPQYQYLLPHPPPPPMNLPPAPSSMYQYYPSSTQYSQFNNQSLNQPPPPPPPPPSSPPPSSMFPPPPPPSQPSSPPPPPSMAPTVGRTKESMGHGEKGASAKQHRPPVPPMAVKKSNGGRNETEEERRLRKKRELEKQKHEEKQRQQLKESQNAVLQKTQILSSGEKGHVSHAKLKVTYRDKTMKFELPLLSGKFELKKEVEKRLELELCSFDISYKEEDGDKDWIFLGRDEEYFRNHLQLFSNQEIKLLIEDS